MRDEMMAAAHESSPSSGHCLTMNNDFSEGDVMLDVGCVAPSDGGCRVWTLFAITGLVRGRGQWGMR